MSDIITENSLNNTQINYFDLWELDADDVYRKEMPNLNFFIDNGIMNASVKEIMNHLKMHTISLREDEVDINWGERVMLLNHFLYSYIIDYRNSPPYDFDFSVYLNTYQV